MMKTTAICFIGAIGMNRSQFRGNATVDENQLVDYIGISEIMKSKLIDVNENVDTFIHCWTPSVSTNMVEIYKPKACEFEQNDIYADEFKSKCYNIGSLYNRASFLLSIQKSLTLMINSGKEYDNILVIRPDVVLFKDLILSELDLVDNIVYSNNGRVHPGDFFYLMNYNTSKTFRNMYEKINPNVNYEIRTMPVDLASELGIDIIDHPNFIAGGDIEVSRKCRWK